MNRYLTNLILVLLLLPLTLVGQEVRPIDGFGNNLQNPEWGAAHSELNRVTPINYGDGVSSLGGVGWPNPRVVSNTLFAQDDLINDPLNLSDYCWVFGQFIDHDLTFVLDGSENVLIQVPTGDPWFDPWGSGQAFIHMRRSAPAPGSGTGVDNPREHVNVITSFLDASAVYGSDSLTAAWLRSFEGGRLKVSADNMLPYNTVDGEYDSPVDPTAPHMEDPIQASDKHFVAGDARANENPLLAGFHTLFVREHNRIADTLAVEHPDWSDEELYQHARRLNSGILQAIVYEEWLPTMGVDLPAYTGYDETVNPSITNVFSAAIFRLGHTLLNGNIMRVDEEGNEIPEGHLELRDAFFQPHLIHESGMEPFFRGMGIQVQQGMDPKVMDDVRNFLFGVPAQGGLDLASINITRSRERGIPGLNAVRIAFGLSPHDNFFDITDDIDRASTLMALYGDVNNIDPWVGGLCEDPMPGALFGPTIMQVLMDQFQAVRDGDRFYYENDEALSDIEKQWIKNTRMVDVVKRNTGIDIMQENVFIAMPHDMLCDTDEPSTSVAGLISMDGGATIENVTVTLLSGGLADLIDETTTDPNGSFDFLDVTTCEGYVVAPFKNDDADNGVSTVDLVVIQQHILGTVSFNSPYQYIAADANNSGAVSTIDMVEIRKVILAMENAFPNNTTWRFVPVDYDFQDPTNPLAEAFPESAAIQNLLEPTTVDFVAIKVGDVNGTATSSFGGDSNERELTQSIFAVNQEELFAGQTREITFHADEIQDLLAYQFTLNYDLSTIELLEIKAKDLPAFGPEQFFHMEAAGAVTFSWNGDAADLEADDALFSLVVKAKTDVDLQDALTINSRYTQAEVFTRSGEVKGAALRFDGLAGGQVVYNKFEVYQNMPNPFDQSTVIGFYLPENGSVTISVFDEDGRMVWEQTGEFATGMNELILDRSDLGTASGILFYQVSSDFGQDSRRMVLK
jgi:hypothetical protein